MKRIKKLISTIVASTFLFSLAAPMAYAKTSDDAINRLKALGTVTGYADGDMKLDQNITRAEFAAIAVRALGLENAAKLSNGKTKFSDVTASHWASGYINLAVDRGVINGYPDKTFKPEQNVTNAEAIAMVVRVLGYEQALEGGTWPTKYISKAAYLELLDNVKIDDYSAKATRGNVFMILDDALETKVWKLDSTKDDGEQTWAEGDTLMAEKLKVKEFKDLVVTDVTTLNNKNDEVTVVGDIDNDGVDETKDYELADGLNAFPYYGLNVKAYIKTDEDKIVTLSTDEDEVFTDKIKAIDITGNTFTFANHDKEIADADTDYYGYFADPKDYVSGDVYAGDKVTVVMDGSNIGKIIKLDMTKEVGIVDEVKNDKIYFNDATDASDVDLDGVDMDYVQIFRDGKPAELSDIVAGDTVSVFDGGSDRYTIFASSDKVTGTLKSVGTIGSTATYKLVVGDKTINTAVDAKYSTNKGDDYNDVNQDKLGDDLVGQDVTVKLNAAGEAAYIIGGEKSETTSNRVIVRNVTFDDNVSSNDDDQVIYLKVTKLDGTETVYTVDNDDYTVSGTTTKAILNLNDDDLQTIQAGSFAYLTLDSNGKVTGIDTPADKGDEVVPLGLFTASDINLDDENDLLTVANSTYVVTDDTKVFDVDSYSATEPTVASELSKSTWTAIEDMSATDFLAKASVWVDDSSIIAIYLNSDTVVSGSDDLWGVAFGAKSAIGGGDYQGTIWENGTLKNYTLESGPESDYTTDNDVVNNVVYYSVNGDGNIDEIHGALAKGTGKVIDSITKSNGKTMVKFTDGTEYVAMTDKVKFFDFSSGTMEEADGISKGQTVDAFDILNSDGEVDTINPDKIVDAFVITAK